MIYECNSCGARFHSTDQTRDQQKNGICPSCGNEDISDVRRGLLERMRELSNSEARGMVFWLSGYYDANPAFWTAVEDYLRKHTRVIDLSGCQTGEEAKQKLSQAIMEAVR